MSLIPKGFSFGVTSAGFYPTVRNELGILVSDRPAVAAATFTQNLFPAAPVLVGKAILQEQNTIRAVLINAGQANACTGEQGIADCKAMLKQLAQEINLKPNEILPASTGVIGGISLDIWSKAIPKAVKNLGQADAEDFARAIMTTDAFPKMAAKTISFADKEVRVLGIAKGAGMICPNMATMLSVLLCDAAIDTASWTALIQRAVEKTFNRVSVDGDTSTNDTVYALANGAADVLVTKIEDMALLEDAVTAVLSDLAYMLVQDGEGSTKVIRINVCGAASEADAAQVARTVGHSQLVKTAMYGCDANWGRIVAAIGRAGVILDPAMVSVTLCGVPLFVLGQPVTTDFDALLEKPLKERDLTVDISLSTENTNTASYTLLTSDLGHAYIDCNASYRS